MSTVTITLKDNDAQVDVQITVNEFDEDSNAVGLGRILESTINTVTEELRSPTTAEVS